MPDISEAELKRLQGGMQLLEQLNGKPESRMLLERSIKAIHPEVETGEDVAARIAQPYVEKITALETTMSEKFSAIEAKDKAVAEAKSQAETEAAFTRLAAAGYQPAGLDKIKALMVDRNIADPEAAAALFDKMNPAPSAEQPGWAPSTWTPDSTADAKADVAALFKDETKWADNEAAKVLNELRLGQN